MLKLWNSALIVEMQDVARNSLKSQLEQLHVKEVASVDSIHRALQAVKGRTFDVILCGYEMKDGRTGQQFLEQGRVEGLIPHSKVFMMVTAHSIEEDVMAVAEWVPDDFIVRPFTPATLYARLVEATTKKFELREILGALDNNELQQVIDRCQNYLDTNSLRHRRYVQRIEAETYLRMEENSKAAQCFEEILSERVAPWAELGLGKALLRLGENDRAQRLLEHVAGTSRHHVDSLDSLARMYENAWDDKTAQAMLAKAVQRSPHRMDRQGRLGELAFRNGDLAAAEGAYGKITTHWAGSCFHGPGAYLRLAEIAIGKGDHAKADELLAWLRRKFPDSTEAKFCLAIWNTDSLRKKGKQDGALSAFNEANSLYQMDSKLPFPRHALLRFGVECLFYGKESVGEKILRDEYINSNRRDALRNLLLSYAPDAATKMKLKLLFDELEEEIQNAYKKWLELAQNGDWEAAIEVALHAFSDQLGNPDAQIMSAQIFLWYINKHGWDDDRFVLARKCLARARSLAPGHTRIPTIEMLAENVKKKYGIRSEPRISGYEPPKPSVVVNTSDADPGSAGVDDELLNLGIVLK